MSCVSATKKLGKVEEKEKERNGEEEGLEIDKHNAFPHNYPPPEEERQTKEERSKEMETEEEWKDKEEGFERGLHNTRPQKIQLPEEERIVAKALDGQR